MLNRQYGIAASSSIVKVAHPEDSQPNERIQGRNRNLPPKLNTVRPPRFDRIASNSSRPPTQLARRGTWRLPSRSRQEPLSLPSGPRHNDGRNAHIVPEAPIAHLATHPTQASSSSTWGVAHYRSISPKLPLEPIRRRTPLDSPNQPPSSPPPLPGRKRKAKESPHSALPPSQKLKIEQSGSPSTQPGIKHEPISPDSIVTSRKLVLESCNFWPTPDSCRKSFSNYSENRREFARAKSKDLARFGLKRTRAFFREDGLVIEWRSEVPVWNDTLLPENPQPQSQLSKKSSTDGSSANTYSETLKRRRDIVDIVDSDVDSLPSKKSRPSDPAMVSVQGPEQNNASPKKEKIAGKHWSEGLSKEAIRKLGRGVEAASLKSHPPPSSLAIPNSCDKRASAFTAASVTPVSSPSKRPALPTRLTPSERKVISAPFSTAASASPDRDKRATSTIDTAARSTHLLVTANSDSSQEIISKPSDDDVFLSHPLLAVLLESTKDVDFPAGKGMGADVDTSSSNVGAPLPEGDEEQGLDSTLHNDEAEARLSRSIDPQVTSKPDDMKHDEAALPETESQEILEYTEADTATGDVKEHADLSASAPLPEEQCLDSTLNSDEAEAQISRTMDPQVTDDMKHDEVALPETESQEILESTDEADTATRDVKEHVDSASAPLPGEQRLDGTLNNDEAGSQTIDLQVARKPDNMRHDEVALPEAKPQEILESTDEADTATGHVKEHVDISVPASLPEEQRLDSTDEAGSQTMDLQVTRKPDGMRHDEGTQSEAESQEIERLCTEEHFVDLPEYEMAEDFLRRFITLFDTDRSELEMGYSNDAILSCRVPSTQPESSAGTPLPSYASTSTLHFGRAEIVDKLNGLIGYHFSPIGVADNTINYDIAVLSQEVINSGPDSIEDKDSVVGGILATLHSHIIRSSSTGIDQTMTLHQTFVLRRRTEVDHEDGGLDESESRLSWPLTVISHHMILREEPLLRPDQLDMISLHSTDKH